MPFIATPRKLDQFSELYHQLAGMLASGITLVQGVELIRNSPPSRSFRGPLDGVLADLKQGYTLAEALSRQRSWLPTFDVALMAAGEKSGRLDHCCRLLAEYYQSRARLIRGVLADAMYPSFVVLLALFIFPPGLLSKLVWEGDVRGFLVPKLTILASIAAVVLVFLFLAQSRRGEWRRRIWEVVLHGVPVVGQARRSLALARLCVALESLLNAGVNAIQAWELAAEVSGSPALRRATARARERMVAGETPGEAIGVTGAFPATFVSMYRSGELSGRLDQSLAYLQQRYQDEGTRKMKLFAEWSVRAVYLVIMGMIGYAIVSFWVGYFDSRLNMIP